MAAVARTIVDLRGLERFRNSLSADLRQKRNGPVRQALHRWKDIWVQQTRARFLKFSRGGGNWPRLAEKTIERKKAGKRLILRAGNDSILDAIDDAEFAAKPGTVNDVPFGVVVMIGGNDRHPSGKISMKRLIEIHDQGRGNNPQRKIIVPPDGKSRQRMGTIMTAALKQTLRNSAI